VEALNTQRFCFFYKEKALVIYSSAFKTVL